MPNTKSAIRRVRRVKKQTQINRIRRSKYKNAIKQMEILIKSKDKAKINKYFHKFTPPKVFENTSPQNFTQI